MNHRVILYHKQATSARTRFLKFDSGSVLAFGPAPALAQLIDGPADNAVLHPSAVLNHVEKKLAFEPGTLKAEGEYQHRLEVPGDTIQIILAAIDTMDPPFQTAEQAGAAFIDLTQARGLPAVELELLRHAYELVLGG